VNARAPAPQDADVRRAMRAKTVRVVTVSKAGRPMIMPLWFVVHDGRVAMTNAATSPTVRNIALHPDVLLLFEAPDGRLLRVRGRARYLTGKDAMAPVARRSVMKYYLEPRAIWRYLRDLRRIPTMREYYRERTEGGVIEVTPSSFEWDANAALV
jgi:hypothetical protein